MKTLIAVPCMSMIHTGFMTALLNMKKQDDSAVAVTEGTLIYSARNILAKAAVDGGYDRILWLDSDMRPPRDLMDCLSADMDEGREFVSGLYFTRMLPVRPVIFKSITDDGQRFVSKVYEDYPKDAVFPIAATGFGAVMMTTRLYLAAAKDAPDGNPFAPIQNLGEDMAFCWRIPKGKTMYCDSRIKVPHIGIMDYTEDMYED